MIVHDASKYVVTVLAFGLVPSAKVGGQPVQDETWTAAEHGGRDVEYLPTMTVKIGRTHHG